MPTLDLLPVTFDDFRRRAEKRLPRGLFDYVDGGAGAEMTLRRNVEDFEQIQLGQRVMRDISDTKTSITFLDEELSMPVILAPVGMAGMMAKRAEVMARKVAARAGIPMCLSTMSICPIEEVATAAEPPLWFQLYMFKDRGVVTEMLERAWEQGVRKLVFTVDLNVVGSRYRDFRNGIAGGTGKWGTLRGGAIEYLLHPSWLLNVALGGRPHAFGNIEKYSPSAHSLPDYRHWVTSQMDASVNWSDIEWLRDQWKGKLILKGILDPQDAKDAHRVGADSIVVSNHGGRQLDGVASGAAMLPRVADALGDAMPLIVDGGVRSGQDVVKALALGARAVMIGRPWIYALAAEGEAGLERMLSLWRMDMNTALGLSGYPHADKVDRGALLQDAEA